MCVVSMIGDYYSDKFQQQYPQIYMGQYTGVWQYEFDQLKKEVQDLKALIVKAKEYDAKNGEPHCEMEEKVKLLKRVAELVGVDIGL